MPAKTSGNQPATNVVLIRVILLRGLLLMQNPASAVNYEMENEES